MTKIISEVQVHPFTTWHIESLVADASVLPPAPPLACDVAREALEAGWPELAAQMAVKKTAEPRKLWRRRATLHEACRAARFVLNANPDYVVEEACDVAVVAWALLKLDIAGVGGPGGEGGRDGATSRLFAWLGAGRWKARHGEAWRTAAQETLWALEAAWAEDRLLPPRMLVAEAINGSTYLAVEQDKPERDGDELDLLVFVELFKFDGLPRVPSRWVYAEACRQMGMAIYDGNLKEGAPWARLYAEMTEHFNRQSDKGEMEIILPFFKRGTAD